MSMFLSKEGAKMLIIYISVSLTILAIFLRLRYVAIIYVLSLIVFFENEGQAFGWFVIAVQIPAFIPSIIGIFIGVSIGRVIRPIIGNKLSSFGCNIFYLLNRHKKEVGNSGLNLDGTKKNCKDDLPLKKESASDELADKKEK